MAFQLIKLASMHIRKSDIPESEHEVALGQAVGIALGLAIPLPADPIPMDKINLFNYIAAEHKRYYSVISEANESAILCTETAISAATATWISRVALSTGIYNSYVQSILVGNGTVNPAVASAVGEIAEDVRDRAFKAF